MKWCSLTKFGGGVNLYNLTDWHAGISTVQRIRKRHNGDDTVEAASAGSTRRNSVTGSCPSLTVLIIQNGHSFVSTTGADLSR